MRWLAVAPLVACSPAPAPVATGNDPSNPSAPAGVTPPVASAAPAPSAAAVYACPMHPGVVASAPGKCPVCGMTLVPKRE